MSGKEPGNPFASLIGLMLMVFVLLVGAVLVSAFFVLLGSIFGG